MTGPILGETCTAVEPTTGHRCDREPNHRQLDGSPHASCAWGIRWDVVAGDLEPAYGELDYELAYEESRAS